MAWESEGPLFDRSQEHLGASDRGITMWRKLTLEQIDKVERGEDPMALVREPEANRVIEFEVSKGKAYEGYVKLRTDDWAKYYDEDKPGQSAGPAPAERGRDRDGAALGGTRHRPPGGRDGPTRRRLLDRGRGPAGLLRATERHARPAGPAVAAREHPLAADFQPPLPAPRHRACVKYSYVSHGRITAVAAVDIGARLVRLGHDGAITGLEPPAARFFRDRGRDARPGTVPPGEWLDELCAHLGRRCWRTREPPDPGLLRTPPLFAGDPPRFDALMVSGGVAEYVYGRERRDFGDLGLRLGRSLRELLDGLSVPLVEGSAGIHATVLGAAQFSVQVSGNTIYVSDPGALPARDVPVVRPAISLTESYVDEAGVRDAVIRALSADDGHRRGPAAVALDWSGPVTARRVGAVARGIVAAHQADQRDPARDPGNPIVLVLARDLARTVGRGVAAVAGRAPPWSRWTACTSRSSTSSTWARYSRTPARCRWW